MSFGSFFLEGSPVLGYSLVKVVPVPHGMGAGDLFADLLLPPEVLVPEKLLDALPLCLLLVAGLGAAQDSGCPSDDDTPTPTPPVEVSDYDRFLDLIDDLRAADTTEERDALTDAFFHTVAYSDGFPIVEGQTVTFVYKQQLGINEPIRVSGQFNDWNPNATTMVRAVPDYYLFWATIEVENPSAYCMYKFVGKDSNNQDVWFADPSARRFQYDDYGEYSLISGGTQSQPSHLERYPAFESATLGNSRDLFLYLPPGYDHEADTYPVLYMHDGQNLFDPSAYYGGWQVDDVIDDLLARGRMQEIIVVGMANTPDRMDEYTHVEDFLPLEGGWVGGDAPAYADFVVNEVKPFVDARYRTRPERESTGVLGSSLGGLVSFYIGWAYPDVFHYVGGMSSTLGWGSINADNETMIEILDAAEKLPLVYYLDSGGGDGGGCVDTDGDGIYDDNPNAGDNYCETVQLRDVLVAKGYTDDELLYVYAPGQEHNEASWNSRMHYPLTFWFPAW